MRHKSFFKRLFGGEIIEKFDSAVNGEILVVKELSGKTVMRVGKIAQSGGMVEEIWTVVFNKLKAENRQPKTVLVLGLGAGTAAKILAEKWPGIKIVGVEIDPEVIKMGKKYFGLGEISNLKIVIEDGIKAIRRQLSTISQKKFDLILVDMYCGQEFPQKAESQEFLNDLKKLLRKKGLIVFNRLYFGKHKNKSEKFAQSLKSSFFQTKIARTDFNLILICQ